MILIKACPCLHTERWRDFADALTFCQTPMGFQCPHLSARILSPRLLAKGCPTDSNHPVILLQACIQYTYPSLLSKNSLSRYFRLVETSGMLVRRPEEHDSDRDWGDTTVS